VRGCFGFYGISTKVESDSKDLLEDYAFEEQIQIMQNASVVVAPHGAGLANVIFSRPGLKVVELVPDRYPSPNYFFRGTVCGHIYFPVLGNLESGIKPIREHDFRWRIDTDKLQRVLKKIM
jgi:capsular polysaccharide biosynthesis protein